MLQDVTDIARAAAAGEHVEALVMPENQQLNGILLSMKLRVISEWYF